MPTKCKARSKLRATPSAVGLTENEAQSRTHLSDDELCISSLLLAVAEQDLEKLAKCLSDGHNVQDSRLEACTPLLLAVKLGNVEMVNMLLQHKASTDDVDASCSTPLHHAAINGFAEIANCLVVGGAVLDQVNKAGCTPLYQAVQHGHIDCVRTLLALGSNLEARTHTGATPLYIASDRGNLALVNILLDAGADANASTTFQMTPLLVASFNGHKDVVSLLLSRKVDIEQRGPCGGTPLYVAAQEGRDSVAELLIQHGADVDARCDADSDLTPSLIAAMQGHDTLTRLLLEAKSDIGVTTGKGSTLTMLAARHGRTNVLKTLVEFVGPKVLNEQNAAGLSVLDVSKSGRHAETTTYIKTALAAQRENDLSVWEASLPDILEELDPQIKKHSKAKTKRKRKANGNDICGTTADMPGPRSFLEQTKEAQDANTCTVGTEKIVHRGSKLDAHSDRNNSEDVRCAAIVKPTIAVSLPESPACAPQEHPVLALTPSINLSATKPLTPLSTSPFGFCTVLPLWPSTPEAWPSLPPAVSLDAIDIALPERAQSGLHLQDFSSFQWFSDSGLGVTEYTNSVFAELWRPCSFVPIASCGDMELK
jgi:ankyrin repeat protein